MGQVVGYSVCPRCRERGQDSREDNLIHYHDGGAHCYACGYHEHPPFLGPAKAKEKDDRGTKKGMLPADFTREVPSSAWKWLLQYGLPYSHWKDSVGYSPKEGRLIILVNNEFSLGRLVEDKPGPKWFNRGDTHRGAYSCGAGESTVVVEDWVSCNKVGQVTESLCLFGTAIHPCHIYFLRDKSNRPIYLWLDADKALESRKKAAQLEMLTGRPVTIITTEQDPKALSINEIKEWLKLK